VDELIARMRLNAQRVGASGAADLLLEAAAALEAAREDGERVKRDIAELYDVMPMLPITAETLDAATDWFTRYCIDFHREINAAIDQARGKGGEGVGDA
jgi:hypothetical protein